MPILKDQNGEMELTDAQRNALMDFVVKFQHIAEDARKVVPPSDEDWQRMQVVGGSGEISVQLLPDVHLLLDALKPFADSARDMPPNTPDEAAWWGPYMQGVNPTARDLRYAKAVLDKFAGIPMIDSPRVVCLCGSTRFSEAFQQANFNETLEGRIVLTIGCDLKSDNELFADKSPQQMAGIKYLLDELHLRKIDLADEILVLNVGQYIGDSTKLEISYAKSKGKAIRYLEPIE